MPGGIFPYTSPLGGAFEVRRARMTGSQTFNKGAIVQTVAAGTVTVLPEDGSEVLVGDLIAQEGGNVGVALNGPGAATSAAIPENFVKNDPDTGNAYDANSWINYVPINRGTRFYTDTILATGGASAETSVNIRGADRGAAFFITYCSATTPDLGWGVERTAATAGMQTEVYAKIIDVLDARGRSVTTAGVGTRYVFEIVNNVVL